MEQFDLLRKAADGMIGKMIAGKGDIRELQFDVDLAGKGYRVYYERVNENNLQVWKMTGYKQIGG